MVLQQRVLHRLDVVEVVVAIGQLGRVHPVDEVVVGRERQRPESARQQLYAESLAEGGLARRAGPCDEHDGIASVALLAAGEDVLGYLHNLLLLQCLRHLYQLRCVPPLYGFVHVAGVGQPHDDVPARLLGKHAERLGLVHLLGQPAGVVPVGYAQQQSLLVALQCPHRQIACRRHQRPVVVVDGVAQRVVVAVYLSAGLQQLHLVGESPFGEHADGLFVGGLRAAEGHVQGYDFLHALAYAPDVLVGQRLGRALLEVAVVAAAERVLYEEFRAGEDVLCGLVEHEAQRAHVDAVARPLAGIEKLHVAVLVQSELQSLRHVVDLGRHHGVGQSDFVGKLLIDIQQRCSLLD